MLTRPKEFNISNIPPTKSNMAFYFPFAGEKEDMKFRHGDRCRVVLTSIYAYGDSGRTGYVSSQSSYDYSYSPYFYSYGGYGGYDYGGYGSYYNNPYYDMYSYYDTSSYYNSSTSSSVIYPRAENKGLTPLCL